MKQLKEIFMKVIFLISACASILAILLICFFLIFQRHSGDVGDRISGIFS